MLGFRLGPQAVPHREGGADKGLEHGRHTGVPPEALPTGAFLFLFFAAPFFFFGTRNGVTDLGCDLQLVRNEAVLTRGRGP